MKAQRQIVGKWGTIIKEGKTVAEGQVREPSSEEEALVHYMTDRCDPEIV
jgi:hypothetical protein